MRNILARTIVGLDIGTCWIRAVIAEVNANDEIEIIAKDRLRELETE